MWENTVCQKQGQSVVIEKASTLVGPSLNKACHNLELTTRLQVLDSCQIQSLVTISEKCLIQLYR